MDSNNWSLVPDEEISVIQLPDSHKLLCRYASVFYNVRVAIVPYPALRLLNGYEHYLFFHFYLVTLQYK